MGKRYEERTYRGKLQRRCFGQIHSGEWQDVENFRFRPEDAFRVRRDGTLARRSNCRACEYADRNKPAFPREIVGYVPVDRYKPFMLEIRHRLGSKAAARRIGIGETTWSNWFNGRTQRAQRESIFKLLVAVREVRETDEVRHKKSIRRGAEARGESVERPKNRLDFYVPTGDKELQTRNNYRKEHIEHEREVERKRRAAKREANG
jgi:DNA-binding transcriptional regulator YdaS (Cro superfamily)